MLKILFWLVVWFVFGLAVLAFCDNDDGDLFHWIYDSPFGIFAVWIIIWPFTLYFYYVKNGKK